MNEIEEFLKNTMEKIEDRGECKVIIEYLGPDVDDDDELWDLVNFEILLNDKHYNKETFQYPSPTDGLEEDEDYEDYEIDSDDPNGYRELCIDAGFRNENIIIE